MGQRFRIEPQSGAGFLLPRGSTLRVIDVEGEQVSDLIAFSSEDPEEWLSSGRSVDYASTIYLTTGHALYSNRSTRMLTIVDDTVGRHDFIFSPCSPEMFQALYNFGPDHPSCFRNLVDNLEPLGISADRIPTTFNIFMNVDIGSNGETKVLPPLSKAGSFVDFRAEMDLIVGLTACSAELSNNWSFKPIEYELNP